MNRIIYLLLILSLCLSSNSCKKDATKVEKPVVDGKLMSYVMLGENPIKEITYTADTLIYELVEPNSYKKYIYNSEHQLTRIDQAFSFSPFSCAMGGGTVRDGEDPRKAPVTLYYTFEYAAGKLSKQSSYYYVNKIATLITYQTYQYENESTLIINVYNPNAKLLYFDKYLFDERGNLSRYEHYVIDSENKSNLISAKEYLYDTKNNPYQIFACEGLPGINTNKNNYIKETSISYNQGVETKTSVETSYEYNSYEFPSNSGNLSFLYVDPTRK